MVQTLFSDTGVTIARKVTHDMRSLHQQQVYMAQWKEMFNVNLKTEIIQSSFSSHNEIKLEIKTRKTENTKTF